MSDICAHKFKLKIYLAFLLLAGCGNQSDYNGPTNITGTATLNWTSSVTRGDGTCLSNMAGYRVVYGPSSSNYINTIDLLLTNPTLTCKTSATPISCGSVTSQTCTYTVTNLATGTWYFAIRAFDDLGLESINSNEGSKIIK